MACSEPQLLGLAFAFEEHLQRMERSAGNLLPVPWIEPEDVAAAVVFLASDKARFMTGSQFVLDAGFHADDPRYRGAIEFFQNDLYGGGDFARVIDKRRAIDNSRTAVQHRHG